MPAIIRPIGSLKSYIAEKPEIEIESGITVREAIVQLGIPPEIVALVIVNDTDQSKDYLINDQDVVKLLAIIGGG